METAVKTCSRCGGVGPFHKNSSNPDGLSYNCISCKNLWANSIEGQARRAYARIKRRCGRDQGYESVECRITLSDFVSWFEVEYVQWRSENPDSEMSIDRKDSTGHYEIGNIRIRDRWENVRDRRRNMNLRAPEGTAYCSGCRVYKPLSEFWKNRSSFAGVENKCKDCKRPGNIARMRARRHRTKPSE